jgi:putative ABC transport system permease protein
METFWQDVRYAVRTLRHSPLFAATVVVTLALTSGATTGIFTIVNGLLLRSMPYPEPDALVMLYQGIPKVVARPWGFSVPDFLAFEERATSFVSMAAFRNRDYELSGVANPERIPGARVSAGLFDTLRVAPALGRSFTREEDQGTRPVAILTDALWRRHFGADPSIVGRAILLDRLAYTVVGVMPRGFAFPNRGPVLNNVPADVYVPISFSASERSGFGSMYNNSVVARLKPGITPAQADAEARSIVRSSALERYPAALKDLAGAISASATPLRDETVGRVSTLLYVLFGAIAVVLLIACADIATLTLTRAVSRQREMAVRAALGAGRRRLITQALIESALLCTAGVAAGLLVARTVAVILANTTALALPSLHEIRIDIPVLAFTVVLAVATTLVCGVVPALEGSRAVAGDALKEGGRSGAPGRRQRRMLGGLVTVQFALSMILLAAGGLLVRSFAKLTAVDPGFQPDRVLTLATSLPATGYPRGADVRTFYLRLMERVQALPGVTAASGSTALPLAIQEHRAFTIENESTATRTLQHSVMHDWVLGQYFETLGIALKRGRFLSSQEHAGSEPVVVINETMARRFWPDRNPVGERIAWGGPAQHGRWMRVVGVVADVKQSALNSETMPQTYQPWLQVDDRMLGENVLGIFRGMKVSVRTAVTPLAVTSAIRDQIRALDPALPVTNVQTLQDVVDTSTGPQRFNAILLGSFAALALLLAALGVGGVLATSVSRRRQEIGVRLALGAQRGDVVRLVVRQGMVLAIAGVAIGLPASIALTRLISSLLFEVTPRDPVTLIAVTTLLIGVAAFACYLPARRATRIEPIVALRQD